MTGTERDSGPESWPIIGLFVTWIIGTLLLVMIGVGLRLMDAGAPYSDAVVVIAFLGPPLAWIAGQLRRRGLRWDVLLGPPAALSWGRCLGLAVALMALSVGALWALWWPLSFVWPGLVERFVLDDDTVLLAGRTGLARGVHAAVLGLAIGVIGPVIEELIFRGVLLRRWAARRGRVTAVLASSILFGLLHVDLLGSVYFGFALCTLALRGGGVRVPIRIHALNNLLALAMGLIDEVLQLSGPPWTVEQFREQAVWALPLFAVSAAWAVWWGRRAARATEWGRATSPLPPRPPAPPPAPPG